MSDKTGISVCSGWYSASEPCARLSQGSATMARKVRSMRAPPALCTHLPRLSPRMVTRMRLAKRIPFNAETKRRLPGIQTVAGPSA